MNMNNQSIWRPDKQEVVVENGAVASAHPIASKVGIDILQDGGNAVDAAIATGFCLNVVEPWSSCIAGHGHMLVYMSDLGKTLSLDYSHRSPMDANANMYQVLGQVEAGNGLYEVESQSNSVGHSSVGVPGVTAGMWKAHELFGSLPMEQLMEPSIHYAREGFDVDWTACLMIAQVMPDLIRYSEGGRVFLPGGYPPIPGEKLVQSDLADVLTRISKEGRDALYKGDIAHAIDEEMKLNGGFLNARDLAAFEVEVSEPLRTSYKGYDILSSPVPSGAFTQLQALNILSYFDIDKLRHNSDRYLHLIVEALRHSFADRYRFLGDPDFGPVPLKGMLSKDYAREIAGMINRENAEMESETELQPWVSFADKIVHNPWNYENNNGLDPIGSMSPPSAGDSTTHFSVIDKSRNMVSCTQTATAGFGSRVVVPGTGILLTNGMVVFNPKDGTPNSIAGNKRGLNNMGAVLVLNDGKPFFALGASGGRKIMSRLVQVILNVIDFDNGIQEAITAPTVDAADRETFADHRLDPEVIEALSRMGHRMEIVPEPSTGGGFAKPRGVMLNEKTGLVHAGVHVIGPDGAYGY